MRSKSIFGVFAALALTASAHAGFLLDYGSPGPYTSGRTVSGTGAGPGGWTVFQPFTVSDPAGWNITTIGTDGWMVTDPGNIGFRGTVLLSVGGQPDEVNPIADRQFFLPFSAGQSQWADVAFNITLPAGDYFMRWDGESTNVHAAIYFGASGPGSFSRRESDGAIFNAGVTALRIDGTVVPAPAALALLGLGLGATRRRRRD